MQIGVDLGTTNSVVARLDENGDPEILENERGERKTPSVVQFPDDGGVIVGTTAKRNQMEVPDRTVPRVKRHMGDQDWAVDIDGEEWGPEAISAEILKKLVADAEEATGEDVEEMVVTVPAYFGPKERNATLNAAKIAEFDKEDIELLNEPTSACLRYGIGDTGAGTVFVYDMGGGTFDATLMNVTPDGEFEVEGVKGGQRLGGEDFDDELYDHVRGEMIDAGHPDPEDNSAMKADVYEKVTDLKHDLSQTESGSISPMVGPGDTFNIDLSRDEFDEITEHLVDETFDYVDALFDHEKVDATKEDVDELLLVGGSTRIPKVQERVEDYFGMEASKGVDQDYVVAEGAAIQTELEPQGGGGGSIVLPRDIGLKTVDPDNDKETFEMILSEQTPVKASESKRGFRKVDKQSPKITIEILEGGKALAEENDKLGEFELKNLDEGSDPEFEVTFTVDEEGKLHAEATNLDTGRKAETTLEIGLTEKEIEGHIQRSEETHDDSVTRD
ncbi:Hsp70 family protein [Halorubrum sp. Atlit-26R]|uniref:Hsp70 family protein n=1 Tax=Halorubrum sp. Atlit-26R TaxID=2282128 RepID=UPI000EF1DA8D|nr:Hsp70 family protein [Halorubrum sp. Atlit-26R]RLM72980.1 Hsp70 family protein [Halorubrum sp. Atlit-26R]